MLIGIGSYAQNSPMPYGPIPTQRQLKWQELEMYCIIHLGLATYTDKEWGYGDENPALFNPVNFDAASIVKAAKSGGFKGIIVVAKHHDGFCIWPTKTTAHNISNSPYKDGKGDMVREYQIACEALGMKMGIYCSPWDRNSTFYGKPEYVTNLYTEQLKELYANYGSLFISWHDGANGGDGYYGGAKEARKIDNSTYYNWDKTWLITRKTQPDAVIFGDVGPDIRWVGNEEGEAGETSWATFTPEAPDPGKEPTSGYSKYWLATAGTKNGKYWMPAECDVPLRPGWFYHSAQNGKSKSARYLLDLYYKSVGRGACLDLGLSPDMSGKLTSEDTEILQQFGFLLKQTFKNNLLKNADFKASNVRAKSMKYSPRWLSDDDRYTYWATDDKIFKPELIATLGHQISFNVIRIRENIKLGQRITGFAVDKWQGGKWKEIAKATSVGANRLIRLPKLISTDKVRLRITGAEASIALSDFALFKAPLEMEKPAISRNNSGQLLIKTTPPVKSIHYTTDGTEPRLNSPEYFNSIHLPDGGIVKARAFNSSTDFSEVATTTFGVSKQKWKIYPAPAIVGQDLKAAIDEEQGTVATVLAIPGSSNSPELSMDMSEVRNVKSITYLPRQDKLTDGTATKYALYLSLDGKNWDKVKVGEFANIKSNPIEQEIELDAVKPARYFRFTALSVLGGNQFTVSEFGVRIK